MAPCSDAYSYACYGCIEFTNNLRTLAYHEWACANDMYPSTCIPEMDSCYCDYEGVPGDYVDPITDDVCWYDAGLPESSEFLGVLVLGVTGFYDSTYSRQAVDIVGEGSSFQRATIAGKTLAFEVALLATSARGMTYGINWMKNVLQGDYRCSVDDCESCTGRKLAIRSVCSYDPGCDPDVDDCDLGLSFFDDVALIDGLSIIDTDDIDPCCCNVMKRATFTLQSRLPYSHSNGKLVYEQEADPSDYTRCFDFDFCDPEDCDWCGFISGGDCVRDPNCGYCGNTSVIVEAPVTNECYCYPWETQIHAYCNPTAPYGISDAAYRILIESGYNINDPDGFQRYGLRNTRVEFYQNPFGQACITDDASYELWDNIEPCLRIWIPYIPPNATLDIDSRNNRISVLCKGQCFDYTNRVYTEFGDLFPILSSCGDVMVVVKYDASMILDDAVVLGEYHKTKTSIYQYRRWN